MGQENMAFEYVGILPFSQQLYYKGTRRHRSAGAIGVRLPPCNPKSQPPGIRFPWRAPPP